MRSPSADIAYVLTRVKLEAGPRSALVPNRTGSVRPYISEDLGNDWLFDVGNLHVIEPSRTYLEKLLILHGAHCGYRDVERLPADADRISRHYYDAAMITATEVGASALVNEALLTAVREHNKPSAKKRTGIYREHSKSTGFKCALPLRSVKLGRNLDFNKRPQSNGSMLNQKGVASIFWTFATMKQIVPNAVPVFDHICPIIQGMNYS